MKILLRTIIFFSIMCAFLSCKKSKEEVNENGIENQEKIIGSKLPETMKVPDKVRVKINGWEEFEKLEDGIKRLYGSGDNVVEAEALVKLESDVAMSAFPDEFNVPPIKSRFVVLKTFLSQLEGATKENASVDEVQSYKIKVIESYNSLLAQFSEVLNKSLAEDFLKNE